MRKKKGSLLEYASVASVLLEQSRFRFRITSSSMAPALLPGDLVKIETTRQTKFEPGQIIVILRGRALVCHRLIRCFEQEGRSWVVTKGDGVSEEDPPVLAQEVAGRVTKVLPPRELHRFLWSMRKKISACLRRGRLRTADLIFNLVRTLEFFSLAFLRPEELIEANRNFFGSPGQVAYWAEQSQTPKLWDNELRFLDKLDLGGGSALVLGSGAGREAISLAKSGWQVVACDYIPELIAAARNNAMRAGVHIEWHCLDVTKELPKRDSFDLICLFGQFYSLIPSQHLRVSLLKALREKLKPTGSCLVSFILGKPPSRQAREAHRWRLRLAWLVRGNPECQLGDVWKKGYLFIHQFASVEEIAEEAALAGLRLAAVEESVWKDMVLLKPRAAPPFSSFHLRPESKT